MKIKGKEKKKAKIINFVHAFCTDIGYTCEVN
jgi:hypothetical protein